MVTKALAKTGSDPAKKKGGEVVDVATTIYDLPTVAEVKEALEVNGKLFWDGDAGESSFLLDTLNKAERGEDLYAESNLESITDHLGEVLTIMSVDGVRNSDYEQGLGVYLIATVATSNGETFKMAIGAATPLAFLTYHHEHDELPWRLKFVQSEKATKAGYYPVNVLSLQGKDDDGVEPF